MTKDIDIRVSSKNRKKQEFCKCNSNAGAHLFIDGQDMGELALWRTYYFHVVDGKIDHWGPSLRSPVSCDGCK